MSNSKSKRMIGILLVYSILLSIAIIYSRSDNGSFVNWFQLPKRNSTNVNKAVYKDIMNTSLVESDHSNAMLLHVNKSLAEISKESSNRTNKQDIISNKTNSNTEISTEKFERFRQTLLQSKLNNGKHEHWLYLQPSNIDFNKSAYDIMSINPITFDNAYKNPCWRGDGRNGTFKDGNLHCLPYFYLIGVRKSGTTDFMSRISRHPEYCNAREKELQWFARRRFGIMMSTELMRMFRRNGYAIRSVEAFSAMFDKATQCIMSHPSTNQTSVTYRRIVADGSPSTFYMHSKWEQLPGNENLTEPRYTNFHYIKHLTPDARIIVLFRDPTTRLYSDFWDYTGGRYGRLSPAVFHDDVLKLISTYKSCFSHSTKRSCVYNNTINGKWLKTGVDLYRTFNTGFYAVFMEDMLSVFGKGRILPIVMSDYITKMKDTLRNVFSFLDMADVSEGIMFEMLNSNKKNSGKSKFTVIPMLKVTREILYDFYRPYNEQMAKLMNDSRYLFTRK